GLLLADDELQLGDEVEEQRSVRVQRPTELIPPPAQLGLRLAEELPDQALEGLGQGGVGNVALELVELAGGEEAARRDQHRVQLVDGRGLPDSGVAADEHQRRRAARDDVLEGGEQGIDLALTPIQMLWYQQPIRAVELAQRELVDDAPGVPIREAA